ncbi:tol-pal system-associated acyl-CoA thioesterase [Denitromonas halophila]|uniref:Tol-pal system-associated acyl-CoA thioesterase n=2 Tax=Denitromonas halophila TaxID=1629404 RepID=A0A557QXQ8_9RHOO|nr:tol-pal system-associated acyl-CoA thioesterase [Denitromonas halophila]
MARMLSTDPAAAIAPESLMARVYYEDTDAAGVVYYANYWRFCERGRTEWLRRQGFDQQQLMDDTGIAFVVRRVTGEYLRPARLDDTLQILTSVSTLKRASLSFSQKILRDAELLFEATVSVACLDTKRNRAVAIPDTIRKTLTPGQPG